MTATADATTSYKGLDPALERCLAVRARDGDMGAFEALVYGFERSLYNFLRLRAGSDDGAEELTQETFLRAFRGLDRYDPARSRFKTWLYTIGLNVWRDQVKSRRGRSEALPVREDVGAEDDALQGLEARDRFARWLGLLDPEAADLVAMRFADGLSYGEIGELTGTPEATVRSKVFRALQKLRSRVVREEGSGR